ncbi:MAG: hypothetical protein RLZZ546_1417, partial [Bacteroidota bacterium]
MKTILLLSLISVFHSSFIHGQLPILIYKKENSNIGFIFRSGFCEKINRNYPITGSYSPTPWTTYGKYYG